MTNSSWLGIYKRHVGNFDMLHVCMLLSSGIVYVYLEKKGEEFKCCTSLQLYISQVEYEYIKGWFT
jgi:hypothetical protein